MTTEYELEREQALQCESLSMPELYSGACREYAINVGAEHSERAWILTDFDSWERNPFYTGPAVPYPEYDYHDDAEFVLPVELPVVRQVANDEIPF